jgi:ribonuclease P protein component
MTVHLRGRTDFQNVYRKGRRYDGSFISVFVLPNELSCHRFGVTASRKALGKAVERNRAKRLLRESFRLSDDLLEALERSYDWVLNAKARLAGRKLNVAFEEFSSVVQKVAHDETAT